MCFATSKYQGECQREYNYISQHGKPAIPVITERDFEPKGALGLLFGTNQRVHITSPDEFDAGVGEILRMTQAFFA